MKRRMVSFLVLVLTTTSMTLSGCGATTSESVVEPKTETVAEIKEEPKAPEKTETVEVEKVEEAKEPEKTEEVEKVETPSETTEVIEEKETANEVSDEKADETTTESTEVQATSNEAAPATTVAAESVDNKATGIWAYVKDGVFDYNGYAISKGGSIDLGNGTEIAFVFGDWFIGISTNISTAERDYVPYVGVGPSSDWSMPYWCELSREGDRVTLSGTAYSIKKDSLDILDALIDYMKANPDLSKKPVVNGITFESD